MQAIRRKDRAIPEKEAHAILNRGEYGILATNDAAGQPYAVPLSYIFYNGKLYFHCALEGHKLNNIEQNPRVSFCVVGPTKPIFHGTGFSTNYESCVAFGTAHVVTDETERHDALRALTIKYFPGMDAEIQNAIDETGMVTAVVAIVIDHVTGKARR